MLRNKERRQVLFNACMYTPQPNGNGIYIREAFNRLSRILDEQGITYNCYAYTNEGFDNPAKVQVISMPFKRGPFSRLISLHRFFWNLFILPFLARKYELVYSFSSHGSPFLSRQVITIHDLICFEFPKQHRLQFFYAKYLLPLILRSCTRVVAISEFTRQAVLQSFRIGPGKVITIHNGGDHLVRKNLLPVASNETVAGITGGLPFFLSVGATYPHKNIIAAIEAFNRLGKDHRFVITGPDNAFYQTIKKMVEERQYTNIVLLNYVDNNLLQRLYQQCVAHVYISLHEGFGFPPMEAAQYNKVSLLSNRGALPEIYGKTAVYVDPTDVDAIASALRTLAAPTFDSRPYTQLFPALFARFTWDHAVEKIYQTILLPELQAAKEA